MITSLVTSSLGIIWLFLPNLVSLSGIDCTNSPLFNLVKDWKTLHIFAEFDYQLIEDGDDLFLGQCETTLLDNYWNEIRALQSLGYPTSVDTGKSRIRNPKNYYSKQGSKYAVIMYPFPSKDGDELIASIRILEERMKSKGIDPAYLFIHIEMNPTDQKEFLDQLGFVGWGITSQIFLIKERKPFMVCPMCAEDYAIPLFDDNNENLYSEDEIKQKWEEANRPPNGKFEDEEIQLFRFSEF